MTLAPASLRSWFATVTVLFVASSAWLLYVGDALVTEVAPYGIVSFELAGSERTARTILESWPPEARLIAALVQGYDFLYLLVYPVWLALCIEWLERAARTARVGESERSIRPSASSSACSAAWIALTAAPLDAVENHALIQQLLAGPDAFHARLAWGCAIAKFGAIAIATAFILVAAGAHSVRRFHGSAPRRSDG